MIKPLARRHKSLFGATALRLIVGLACLLSTTSGRSQDHLQPETGALNKTESALRSAARLRALLLKDSAFHYRARVICIPSFEPRWVMTLAFEDGDQPGFYLEYATFVGRPVLTVEKLRVTPSKEFAEALQDVWIRMLRNVHYSGNPVGGGADGTIYHFSRFIPLGTSDPKAPPGWEAGCIWTPEPSSLTGRLSELSQSLRRYVNAPVEKRKDLEINMMDFIKKSGF